MQFCLQKVVRISEFYVGSFYMKLSFLLFSFFSGVEPVVEQIMPRNEAKQVNTKAFNSFFTD